MMDTNNCGENEISCKGFNIYLLHHFDVRTFSNQLTAYLFQLSQLPIYWFLKIIKTVPILQIKYKTSNGIAFFILNIE